MKRISVFLIVSIFLSSWGCKAHKPASTVIKSLKLGEGGGFTGAWQFWSVNQAGKVYFTGSDGKMEEKEVLDIKIVNALFSDVDAFFKSKKGILNNPGNMSRNITYVDGGTEKQVTWVADDSRYAQLDSMYNSWLNRMSAK